MVYFHCDAAYKYNFAVGGRTGLQRVYKTNSYAFILLHKVMAKLSGKHVSVYERGVHYHIGN